MLLTTWRPNEMAHGSMADFAQRIPAVTLSLPPLAADESAAFARSIIGHDEGVITSIVREAEGNPFFVNELARFHADSDLEAAAPDGGVALSEVLMSRVEALAEKQQRLFELIVVSAGPVERSVLLSAVESAEGAAPMLDALCTVQLVRRTPGPEGRELLTVYHDRVREVVAERLPQDVVASCHEGLAAALTRRGDADPEALLAHYLGAGQSKRAGEAALEAAKRAFLALAFDHAAELYRTAIEFADLDDAAQRVVQEQLGEALGNAGRVREAAEAFLAAADGGDEAAAEDLQRRAAHQYLVGGYMLEGKAVASSVLARYGLRLAKTYWGALVSLLWCRARVRLRGLRFVERSEEAVPVSDLTRIDSCWSVSLGLSLADSIRGSEFGAKHLVWALRAGEPYRVVRAFAVESGFLSVWGPRAYKRSRDLSERAARIAERLENPHATGLVLVTSGLAAFCNGLWEKASADIERAIPILRNNCVGVTWELDSALMFEEWSMFYRGRLRDLAARVPGRLEYALARGDRYAATSLPSAFGTVAWLVTDEVADVSSKLEDARAGWNAPGFQIQHYHFLVGEGARDLYSGASQALHDRMERDWSALRSAMMLRFHICRAQLVHLRATGAALVGMEAGGRRQARLLRKAARWARRLTRESVTCGPPQGRALLAAIDAFYGRTAKALERLAIAQAEFEAAGMALFAAATAYQRGHLLGGEEGAAMKEKAVHQFTSEGVVRPERMIRMHIPGFEP